MLCSSHTHGSQIGDLRYPNHWRDRVILADYPMPNPPRQLFQTAIQQRLSTNCVILSATLRRSMGESRSQVHVTPWAGTHCSTVVCASTCVAMLSVESIRSQPAILFQSCTWVQARRGTRS